MLPTCYLSDDLVTNGVSDQTSVTLTTPAIPLPSRSYAPAILTVALLSRLLIVWFTIVHFPHNWLYSRGIELGTLAESLAQGRGLSSPFGGSTGPTALLAPGYPILIAGWFRLLGGYTFSAAVAVMLMQVIFSLLTVWVVMQIARRCFSAQAAHLAGSFWALSLPLLWMPTIFWETCLSTLLLVGLVALLLHYEQKTHAALYLWLLVGGYCAASALINPSLLPAMVAMVMWSALQAVKKARLASLARLLAFMVAFLAIFVAWPLRNARTMHAFIPLRSTTGFELWVGNHQGATGFLEEGQFPIFNRYEYDSYVAKGEVLYMRDKWAAGEAYIRAHPVTFINLSLIRMARFWTGTGSKDGSLFFAAHAVLTTSLGFAGMARLLREQRFRLALLFLLPLLLFPLPYYITHAEFRYRLVIDPLLTLLSAYAVSNLPWRGIAGE